MPTQSVIFIRRKFVSLKRYDTPLKTNIAVTVPAKAHFMRAAMVGCGGWSKATNQLGAGGAYARVGLSVSAGDTFTLFLGDPTETQGSSTGIATNCETWLKRDSDSVVVLKADYGRTNATAGSVANSIGDVTRAGLTGEHYGLSGSDAADAISWGLGGTKGAYPFKSPESAALPGSGGFDNLLTNKNTHWAWRPGHGSAVIAFFTADPGWDS